MGKLGRTACIAIPMLLSIASLISLFLVFLGGTNKGNTTLRGLYYFKADTSGFKANFTSITTGNSAIDSEIASLLGSASTNGALADFYEIYMWNYCKGDITNGKETVTFCSPRKAKFFFDPITEWGINGTVVQKLIPSGVNDALKAYDKGAQWVFIVYAIAFWVTVASIVFGLLAICSRIGSCLTSVVAWVATVFATLSAIIATALYATLVGAMDGFLKEYQIKFTLGTRMLSVEWIAVAFSLAASLFWTISICCCSGKSSRKDRKSQEPAGYSAYAPFGNRGYAPIAEPHHQRGNSNPYVPPPAPGMEMQDFGYTGSGYKGRDTAYEPFRHGQV